MPYTTQLAIQRVYTLLRKPSQGRLYYEDVRDALNARLSGYVRDMELAGRDHRTVTEEVDVVEDDVDFLLTVPSAPDFEAVKLEYLESLNTNTQGWLPAKLVPFAAWEQNFNSGRVVASIYGSYALTEGQKLRLNLTPESASLLTFRLSYRLPLLAAVQMGERPPIPEGHMPMLEYDTALDCMPLVDDDSDGWLKWVARTTQMYVMRSREEHERWEKYLESSVEDPVQPLARYDEFRRRGNTRSTRGYLPRQ